MPRERTQRVELVKQQLIQRIREGLFRPGDRFLSNRAVAEGFELSYQTAHRLIVELCREGHLERRPQSGTYVPGVRLRFTGAELVFHPRGQRAGSFGAKLTDRLTARLDANQLAWRLHWTEEVPTLAEDRVPVVWESPATIHSCVEHRRPAVLINDYPPSGIGALYIDSVATNDFFGGACAAQLLLTRNGSRRGVAVLAGPEADLRSRQRVEGFRSVHPGAAVIRADGWLSGDGYGLAPQAVRRGSAGLFCCNDNLAEAVVRWCEDHAAAPPPLVGFDDAPVAERLNLTTIALPWDELVEGVVRVLKQRLRGDRSTSSQQTFNPRPVIRGFR